jgi:hypothetical protein
MRFEHEKTWPDRSKIARTCNELLKAVGGVRIPVLSIEE